MSDQPAPYPKNPLGPIPHLPPFNDPECVAHALRFYLDHNEDWEGSQKAIYQDLYERYAASGESLRRALVQIGR